MATDVNTYGLYFPIALVDGAPVRPYLVDSIDASIRAILAWAYSSRYFMYTFGSVLERLQGMPASSKSMYLIQQYVIRAITRWETRITLKEVTIEYDDISDTVTVSIEAQINNTQETYNYTVPL